MRKTPDLPLKRSLRESCSWIEFNIDLTFVPQQAQCDPTQISLNHYLERAVAGREEDKCLASALAMNEGSMKCC